MGSQSLINPVSFPSITALLAAMLNVVIVISVPIIVAYLIYAGFLYVTARGNATQIEQASKALLYGVIGGVIIIGATAIITIVKSTVEAF